MKALAVSSLTMMAIASSISVTTLNTATTSDHTAELDKFELISRGQYQSQGQQFGGGGTGRREILSQGMVDSIIV